MRKVLVFVCFMVLVATGCAKKAPQSVDADVKMVAVNAEYLANEKLYTIETNGDYTYNYEIRDIRGSVLISDENISRQPVIEEVTENLLKVSVQTGIGRATRWTMYCDVVNGRVSDGFYYVLAETEDKVVCVEYNEQYNVVVRDIFNREKIYGGTVLEDVYTVEPIVECKKVDNKLKIVYLKGNDYTEEEVVVQVD